MIPVRKKGDSNNSSEFGSEYGKVFEVTQEIHGREFNHAGIIVSIVSFLNCSPILTL